MDVNYPQRHQELLTLLEKLGKELPDLSLDLHASTRTRSHPVPYRRK
jgi:hypothetical protein